jgi:spore coat polysaccharide biosynthesis protein SpsF
MPKAGIITQARMTSTRLPGKILLETDGATVLEHHCRRLAWSTIPIFIATTTNSSDQPIVELARELNLPYYRGDEQNVLQRFYQCAQHHALEIIVRVTSDCPLVDGNLIAQGLENYLGFDDKNIYYSNALVRKFPRGLDFEIFSFDLLKDAYEHATEESDREHVTPYINKNRSGKTILKHYVTEEDNSDLRWTLDTQDDWELIRTLFETYKVAGLTYREILDIVRKHPELESINKYIKQKEI